MGIFKKGEPAAVPAPVTPPATKPLDMDLARQLDPSLTTPKRTRGRITAPQWKAAELHWRQCRRFTEVAERLGCSSSHVARRAGREDWPARMSRDSATDMRESQAAIVARVNEQVARLQPEDREALVAALRADHVKLAAELKATALEAIGRLGVDRVVDAIRLLDLGVSIEQGLMGDKAHDHRSLTVVLQQQREKFAAKPKIKVTEGGDA